MNDCFKALKTIEAEFYIKLRTMAWNKNTVKGVFIYKSMQRNAMLHTYLSMLKHWSYCHIVFTLWMSCLISIVKRKSTDASCVHCLCTYLLVAIVSIIVAGRNGDIQPHQCYCSKPSTTCSMDKTLESLHIKKATMSRYT